MSQYTYRYKCITESKNIEEIRISTDPTPTTCINNIAHTINTNSITIIRKASSPTAIVVSTSDPQELSNKTLVEPIITSISNGGTINFPAGNDTLLGRDTSDSLANKTLKNDTCFHVDPTDITKKIGYDTSNATTLSTTILIASQTENISLTLPIITDTLVGRTTTDTLTNKTLTAPIISTIVNTGTLTLPTSTDTLVGKATTDTLTNKSMSNTNCFHVDGSDITKKVGFQTSGATTSTTTTIVAGQAGNISLTLPITTDTILGRATIDTLTNKTIQGTTNIVDANNLKTTTLEKQACEGVLVFLFI